MSFLASTGFFIIPFLLVLGPVVTVHELGHFLVARLLGTKIDRFSIGLGRAILSWRDRSGVEWRVGWLPIGGYVRFAGDENAASVPDTLELEAMRHEVRAREGEKALSGYFHFMPLWKRALIVVAGPAVNFLFAIAIFAAILLALGETLRPFQVQAVAPNSPAAAAGFRPGDVILAVDGRTQRDIESVREAIRERGGVPTTFAVERAGRRVELLATPRWEVQDDPVGGAQRVGAIGVAAEARVHVTHVSYGPVSAVAAGVAQTWDVLTTTVHYLGRLITGHASADQLRGPLGIADATRNVAKLSAQGASGLGDMLISVALNLVHVAAILSVSLGFMNLLPIPLLDGGHLLFYAWEAVARRPPDARVQAAGYRLGLALVLGLMLFATWNDLQRLHVFNLFNRLSS